MIYNLKKDEKDLRDHYYNDNKFKWKLRLIYRKILKFLNH